jgi:hypothetical protein
VPALAVSLLNLITKSIRQEKMGVIELVKKKLFRHEEVELHRRLGMMKDLPEEKREDELASFLHDHCARRASGFASWELGRKDSPFRGASEAVFFHEAAIINFWILDKVLEGKKKDLLDRIHRKYSEGLRGGHDAAKISITERYRVYYKSWDEVTGHHDLFGRRASEYIMGTEGNFRVDETSFWLISHVDETIKDLTKLLKTCRKIGLV